jgi:hypothetical protein
MKKFTKLITALGVVLAITISSYEKIGARAAAVTISNPPICITKNEDMSFGNLAVSPSIPGMVVLTPYGKRFTGWPGGVTLASGPGNVAAADFTVSGAANYTYAITLPAWVSINSGGNKMTMTAFTSFPAVNGVLSAGGQQELKVGASLFVPAAQAPGDYTNSSGVTITVNYN